MTGQVQAAAPDKERIQELEEQLKELRYPPEAYEKWEWVWQLLPLSFGDEPRS